MRQPCRGRVQGPFNFFHSALFVSPYSLSSRLLTARLTPRLASSKGRRTCAYVPRTPWCTSGTRRTHRSMSTVRATSLGLHSVGARSWGTGRESETGSVWDCVRVKRKKSVQGIKEAGEWAMRRYHSRTGSFATSRLEHP